MSRSSEISPSTPPIRLLPAVTPTTAHLNRTFLSGIHPTLSSTQPSLSSIHRHQPHLNMPDDEPKKQQDGRPEKDHDEDEEEVKYTPEEEAVCARSAIRSVRELTKQSPGRPQGIPDPQG